MTILGFVFHLSLLFQWQQVFLFQTFTHANANFASPNGFPATYSFGWRRKRHYPIPIKIRRQGHNIRAYIKNEKENEKENKRNSKKRTSLDTAMVYLVAWTVCSYGLNPPGQISSTATYNISHRVNNKWLIYKRNFISLFKCNVVT